MLELARRHFRKMTGGLETRGEFVMVNRAAHTVEVETLWPPDDTEESVVGAEYHQHVIDAARDGLRMAAGANGATWRVLSQVPLAEAGNLAALQALLGLPPRDE